MLTISRIYYYNLNRQLKQSKTPCLSLFFVDFFIFWRIFYLGTFRIVKFTQNPAPQRADKTARRGRTASECGATEPARTRA